MRGTIKATVRVYSIQKGRSWGLRLCIRSLLLSLGALFIRIGYRVYSTIIIIRNPKTLF